MSSGISIGGFAVIPVIYNEGSSDPSISKKKQPTQHYIYARAQQKTKNSKSSWPDGRTLFLVNVPPDATERELMMLFKPYGTIERVVFDLDGEKEEEELEESDEDEDGMGVETVPADLEDKEEDEGPRRKRRKIVKPQVVPLPVKTRRRLRKTGQTAHVVFLDSSSLDRSLSIAPQKPRLWPISDEEPCGLGHYTTLYDSLRPPLEAVREHADTYMELFEFELAKTKQKSKYRKGEAIVDEDGFTLVTRGGAYGQTLGGGVAVATKRFQETGETSERQAGRPKKKEKTNFYAFQKAEKQRNGMGFLTHLFFFFSFYELSFIQISSS
ncbi:hypothetical protein E1B28_006639 [Marasmius oreades]|uniref:RRM domain-containing protein n=1 Tax=Marasmius oreades TaxID=181124 RepID=A0A9P8AAY5_9AGAR|nr:uncharacterized protein E1B28_006639 [Marasmius oreades]KAG7095955.1 hypothetical protein E1B28_006639 [Marasmius oreades]